MTRKVGTRVSRLILVALPFLLCACRLVLIGDSHTSGGCTDNPCTPFAETMEAELANTLDVDRLGVPGSTMFQWGVLDVFYPYFADWMDGSIVQVMLGTNDMVFETPVVVFRGAAEALIDRLQEDGAALVVLIPTPPSPYSPLRHQVFLYQYRMQVLDICAGRDGVECGPDPWNFLTAESFGVGNVHLNLRGHDQMAEALVGFYTGR